MQSLRLLSYKNRVFGAVSNKVTTFTSLLPTVLDRTWVGAITKPEIFRKISTSVSLAKKHSWKYFWQPGSGHYGKNWGETGRAIINNWDEFILSQIDSVPVLSTNGVFTIGDYGTCDGFASQQLINKIISHLRSKHGPDLTIQVLYEDQETNDFNSLFKTIYDEASFLWKFDKVFILACGTQFYKQCVPDNSCDLIICSLATHWLSDKYFDRCSESILPWCTNSEKELEDYLEVCRQDWQQFLLHRTAELKPGGVLFVTHPAHDCPHKAASEIFSIPKSQTGFLPGCFQDILLTYDLSWKELYEEGAITTKEFQACTFRVANRTFLDLVEPFEKAADSPVRDAGLTLLKEPVPEIIPCSSKQRWRQRLKTDGDDDRVYFADLITRGTRVFSESTFRRSLLDMRTADEHSAIIERLYTIFRRKVSVSNPETFRSEMVMWLLAAQKIL